MQVTEQQGEVDFYFGALSPYSWFAAERIRSVLPRARWRPVFAGGLFELVGRTPWGLTNRRAAKIADCELRAGELGLAPIRWPRGWPSSDLYVARALLLAEDVGRLEVLALAAMRAAFYAGVELSDVDELASIAEHAGLEGSPLKAAIAEPALKARLRAATAAAAERGVRGLPTFAVGDRLWWGEDRLDEVTRHVTAVRRHR